MLGGESVELLMSGRRWQGDASESLLDGPGVLRPVCRVLAQEAHHEGL
jgi:hypothetical protein